jgi:DNA-binding phage protein
MSCFGWNGWNQKIEKTKDSLFLSNKNHYNVLYITKQPIRTFKMNFTLATSSEILQALGERLRAQRLAQSLQQRELALRAGLSLGAVRKLEHGGQCSMETLLRVVQVLGLTGELESLFVLRRESIAQMEKAEQAGRQRAPRSKRR